MGLLDQFAGSPQQGGGQSPQTPQFTQGLLGPGAGQSGQGGGSSGMQMASQLAQNPTPQVARQIIQQLHQIGNPEARQFEQVLTQAMNDPNALKQIAASVMQKLGGQNA